MTKSYTTKCEAEVAIINANMQAYIASNTRKIPGQPPIWMEYNPANPNAARESTQEEIEIHQSQIHAYKQAIENLQQQSVIDRFDEIKNMRIGEYAPDDLRELRIQIQKVEPLVWRRSYPEIVKTITGIDTIKPDGSLFSFTEPIEIETIYAFCDCGAFPKPAEEMEEGERTLAEEHLRFCKNIREEHVKGKSSVMKHKVGLWDCKSCYKEPVKKGSDLEMMALKTTTEWCPRFLRPFRMMSPIGYAAEQQSSKNNASAAILTGEPFKGCYAGILHRQLSVEIRDDKQYVVEEKMCDTCGYKTKTEREIAINVDQETNHPQSKIIEGETVSQEPIQQRTQEVQQCEDTKAYEQHQTAKANKASSQVHVSEVGKWPEEDESKAKAKAYANSQRSIYEEH